MKKLFKIGCLGFIALIALGIIIGLVSGGGSDSSEKSATPKTEEPKPIKGDQITKPNYDSIVQGDALTGEGGMTIEQVTAILGKPDSNTESQSGDMKMESYTWHKGLTGPSVAVTFINGHVSNKLWMD